MAIVKNSIRFFIITASVVLFLVIAFIGGRYVLYIKIRNTIETELQSFRDQGIIIEYDHLEVNPWKGKIEFLQLRVKVRKDGKNKGADVNVPYILIKGIDILPYLISNTLSLHEITAQDPYINYAKGSTLFDSGVKKKKRGKLDNILVGKVDLPGLDIYLRDTTGIDTLSHVLTDVLMTDLHIARRLDSLTWQKGEVHVTRFAMRMAQDYIGVSAKKIYANLRERELAIDSLVIHPVLGKIQYMQAHQEQKTWTSGSIPKLRIKGVHWFTYPAPTLDIEKVSLSFAFDLYRDKRYPFKSENPRPLPSHFLQRIPVRLLIDSIEVNNSSVSYEEYPEEGDSTGTISFSGLNAAIVNLHNFRGMKIESKMFATAKFMNSGDLTAKFTFPYDTLQPYSVSGELQNMELSRLNGILGSAVKTKIESGLLTSLTFDFDYTTQRSYGKVAIAYDNLKIVTLRENRKNEQSVSVIKTMLLNTFIIKKDLTEDVTSDSRTGTIEFTPDRRKSVFNYWWKSILSGVKSAYNIDKLTGNKNNIRKERKDKKEKKKLKNIVSDLF